MSLGYRGAFRTSDRERAGDLGRTEPGRCGKAARTFSAATDGIEAAVADALEKPNPMEVIPMRKMPISIGGAFATVALAAGVASATPSTAGPKTVALTIPHVQKGCHVWKNGRRQTVKLQLSLRRGDHVVIVNHDINGHRLVQTSGRRVATGAAMNMHSRRHLVFPSAGTYGFKSRAFELKGVPEIPSMGPDNTLRLTVTVR